MDTCHHESLYLDTGDRNHEMCFINVEGSNERNEDSSSGDCRISIYFPPVEDAPYLTTCEYPGTVPYPLEKTSGVSATQFEMTKNVPGDII